MIRIKNSVVSTDLVNAYFSCNLRSCKGNCCKYGDAGAPLTNEEARMLNDIYGLIESYLRPEGVRAVKAQGTSVTDEEGELVTPLIGNEECAYTLMEGDIYMCAIEKAWHDGVIAFRKPLSCHLFPVRVKEYEVFTAVNYEQWMICKGARKAGGKAEIPLFRFLKEPLIRAFGKEWYDELEAVSRELPRLV